MTARSNVLNTIEPQPYVHISKNEMKKYDFDQDETVELSTRRGKVKVKVRFDKMIPDEWCSSLLLRKCASQSTDQSGTGPRW